MRARSVLVVDDDSLQVETLALLLRDSGYRVETATSPLYALTLAAQFSADVVFLDIGLPLMDGYEVLARLKKYFPRAKFYAITGLPESEIRSKAMDAGFDGYFLKPLDFELIEKAVQETSDGASP